METSGRDAVWAHHSRESTMSPTDALSAAARPPLFAITPAGCGLAIRLGARGRRGVARSRLATER
jgi:hypothetical protein